MLLAVAGELGVDPAFARAATGFGGGIGRQGSFCGALTGSVIGIGFGCGRVEPGDAAARDRSYALAAEMYRWFQETNGARDCRELIGVDLSTTEGFAAYRASDLKDTRCSRFVGKAAAKVVEMINNS